MTALGSQSHWLWAWHLLHGELLDQHRVQVHPWKLHPYEGKAGQMVGFKEYKQSSNAVMNYLSITALPTTLAHSDHGEV